MPMATPICVAILHVARKCRLLRIYKAVRTRGLVPPPVLEASSMKRAFTLIELLIVVAIIAILAAIAVPNFLEAQTRAKVARVKNDQRVIATALESYAVDHN